MKFLGCFLFFVAVLAEGDEHVATPSQAPANAEKHQFTTDVTKMLDIIINSLYTNRNVFLRELISNSADALEKARFALLTDKKEAKNDAGEEATFDIHLSINKTLRTLTVSDGGCGMTKEELVAHLGKIGASGTKAFVENAQATGGDPSAFIGQFGVGFYSAFLVADRVRVASKSANSDKQYVWESAADGAYELYEDPRGNTLGRGSEITLHLKPDAEEFMDQEKVQSIAEKYSEFISFPIYLRKSKEEQRPVEAAPKETSADIDVSEDDSAKTEAPKTETVTVFEEKRINEQKPIWTRKPAEVTEEQYKEFYKALSKDFSDPLAWEHFSAEGEVEITSILYIPAAAPEKMFEVADKVTSGIKLFVRRVFITDDFKDLLPRYLAFITGVVDSNDLPLNVSRELLQESRILKIIKRKLVRKVLTMIKDISDKDDYEEKEYNEKKSSSEEDASALKKPELKYPKFYQEYSKALKLGLIEDSSNRARLAKLLRYHTTKARGETEWRSLEQYVDDMKEGQNDIFFVVGLGASVEDLAKRPYIQRFVKAGVEVLIMDDPLDEYVVGHMTEFLGKKLVNLAKEDAKVPGEDTPAAKAAAEKRGAVNKDFLDWLKGLLKDEVEKVVLSDRLVDSPAVIVSSKYGITANMAQIIKGTPLGEKMRHMSTKVSKVMEINLNHPIIRTLRDKARLNPDDENLANQAVLIYEAALFESGVPLENPNAFVQRMHKQLGNSLGVESFAPLADEELPAEEQATEAEEVIDETPTANAADEEL